MTDELLDAGYLHSPNFWPSDAAPWEPPKGHCRASVHAAGGSMFGHQCTRKIKVERDVFYHGEPMRVGYCGQHDPVAVKIKDDARRAKWKAEWEEKNRKWDEKKRLAKLYDASLAAIRRIAAGHNDPRGLALEVLVEFGETLP